MDLRQVCAARLLGSSPGDSAPLVGAAFGLVIAPSAHGMLCLPGHDGIDADLGHELNRALAAIALGHSLHHDDARLRTLLIGHGADSDRDRVLARVLDDTAYASAPAVDHFDRFAGAEAEHARGVVSLGTGELHVRAGHGVIEGVDDEDVHPHQRPLNASRSREKRPPLAAASCSCTRRVMPSSPRARAN